MLKVKDVMTKNVICVKKDTSIPEALEYLERHNISGLPVVEEDMSLIGILSEKDVLRFFYEDEEESLDHRPSCTFFHGRMRSHSHKRRGLALPVW